MNKMAPRYSDTCSSFPYSLAYHDIHKIAIVIAIITVSFLMFDLQYAIISSTSGARNDGTAYAHIFSDTENSITKKVDGNYQVAFLPYPIPGINTSLIFFSRKKSFVKIAESEGSSPHII